MNTKIKIIEHDSFTVAGLSYHGRNLQGEVSALWNEFLGRIDELGELIINPETTWGVSVVDKDAPVHGGEFSYLASIQVDLDSPIPNGFTKIVVPASKWAVFEHHGSLDTLDDTYKKIYDLYLPDAGIEYDVWELELYDPRFKINSPESVMEIWVKIKS